MPTLWQTIKYGWGRYVTPRRVLIKHILRVVLSILIISFLLEFFVCNFRYWTTLFNKPIDLSEKINLAKTGDGKFILSEQNNVIEIHNIDSHVTSINVDLDKNQDPVDFAWKVNFTDETHNNFFDTTDYTVGVPQINMSTASDRSQYFTLHTTGNVKSLKFEANGKKIQYPIFINSIIINAHYPFSFVSWRFWFIFFIIYLIYIFRPKSSLYKISLTDNPVFSRFIIICVVSIEVVLLSSFLFFGSNNVGVATSDYNSGEWDGTSIINTYEVGGDNAQQYAELAKSFTQGKLYLNQKPPDYLEQISDPYDKGLRDEAQKTTGEKYLFDVAYYQGHYYVYFGVVPVLIFYLPFYMLCGQNFPTAIGVLIMAILFIVGISLLLLRFSRWHFKSVSMGLYMLLQIPLIVCSGLLYIVKFPTFYSLPIICAVTFAVLGMLFWMIGRSSKTPCRWYIAGSTCMALIVGCRPQIFVCALIFIPLFWRKFVTNHKTQGIATKQGRIQFTALILPFVIVAIGLMSYNYARFGSVTNFGANYNLTMNDMTMRGLEWARILPAFFAFFIQPANVSGVFPHLNPVVFDTTYYGQTIKEVTFGGVFACIPILWILFLSRPLLKLRFKERKTNTVAGVIIVFMISSLIIPILDAQMAGILQRYFADFSFMLLISAALLIFIANEHILLLNNNVIFTARCSLLIVVGLSVAYSLLTCFVVEVNWYGDVFMWAYRDLLRQITFWV